MRHAAIDPGRRHDSLDDRRAVKRGGRRNGDARKAWFRRQSLWLTAVSVMYVGWRRMAGRAKGVDA